MFGDGEKPEYREGQERFKGYLREQGFNQKDADRLSRESIQRLHQKRVVEGRK